MVKSNDEPYSFTSSGSRDAVIFNNVIQGPAVVAAYLLYDPKPNPGLNVQGAGQPQSHGATLLRTVEAYPRGSIEGGYHIGGRDGGGVPGRVALAVDGKGNYDYVASFTGTYTRLGGASRRAPAELPAAIPDPPPCGFYARVPCADVRPQPAADGLALPRAARVRHVPRNQEAGQEPRPRRTSSKTTPRRQWQRATFSRLCPFPRARRGCASTCRTSSPSCATRC